MLDSELIINSDGSIYHLALHPDEIADVILLVGDQNRVERVSRHFDRIDMRRAKREFVTHTGWIGNKRLSVLSTGIGTDNVDIVVNELDALVNVDLVHRKEKDAKRSLTLVRLGTAGGFDASIAVDSIVTSAWGMGLDPMPQYYEGGEDNIVRPFAADADNLPEFIRSAYIVPASRRMSSQFNGLGQSGITLTCMGFYGPQGREVRLASKLAPIIPKLKQFRYQDNAILNLEMETAALYFLAGLLGHHSFSISAILANRVRGEYSSNPTTAVDRMITQVLGHIA